MSSPRGQEEAGSVRCTRGGANGWETFWLRYFAQYQMGPDYGIILVDGAGLGEFCSGGWVSGRKSWRTNHYAATYEVLSQRIHALPAAFARIVLAGTASGFGGLSPFKSLVDVAGRASRESTAIGPPGRSQLFPFFESKKFFEKENFPDVNKRLRWFCPAVGIMFQP